jgi:hypothetical protein
MHITLVLGPFLPVPTVLGGAVEKAHVLLARAYRAAGHEVTIISRQYKNFAHEEMIDGIRHLRFASFDRTSSLPINLALDGCYAARVSLNLPPSDITITNSFFLTLLLRRRTGGKIYVHVARFPKHQMLLYSRAAISRSIADQIIRQAPTPLGRLRVHRRERRRPGVRLRCRRSGPRASGQLFIPERLGCSN